MNWAEKEGALKEDAKKLQVHLDQLKEQNDLLMQEITTVSPPLRESDRVHDMHESIFDGFRSLRSCKRWKVAKRRRRPGANSS